jgi:hypothetical protein
VAALLADPGLVLEPDFYCRTGRGPEQGMADQRGEVS